MNDIKHNISAIQQQLTKLRIHYSHPIKLIAVSKTMEVDKIITAYNAGIFAFGENYLQEFKDKAGQLAHLPIEWHFIGTIQSNKSRIIAKHASYLHTLTKISHAVRINNQRPENLPPLNVLIEINISGETSKQGLSEETEITALATEILRLPRLKLCGLMGMASDSSDNQLISSQFKALAHWQARLLELGFILPELSMGMSNDYPLAIEAGATMVRVGSKIFGKRNYDN